MQLCYKLIKAEEEEERILLVLSSCSSSSASAPSANTIQGWLIGEYSWRGFLYVHKKGSGKSVGSGLSWCNDMAMQVMCLVEMRNNLKPSCLLNWCFHNVNVCMHHLSSLKFAHKRLKILTRNDKIEVCTLIKQERMSAWLLRLGQTIRFARLPQICIAKDLIQ